MKVSGPGSDKQITTYAFLDNGSDLESEPTDFTLTTMNHEGKECGCRASLKIEALDGKTKFTLDQVLMTECLPIGEKHCQQQRIEKVASP